MKFERRCVKELRETLGLVKIAAGHVKVAVAVIVCRNCMLNCDGRNRGTGAADRDRGSEGGCD